MWPVIINGFGICYMGLGWTHARARGEKVQSIFRLFFISLMQAIA